MKMKMNGVRTVEQGRETTDGKSIWNYSECEESELVDDDFGIF